jgi:hypothetical protein
VLPLDSLAPGEPADLLATRHWPVRSNIGKTNRRRDTTSLLYTWGASEKGVPAHSCMLPDLSNYDGQNVFNRMYAYTCVRLCTPTRRRHAIMCSPARAVQECMQEPAGPTTMQPGAAQTRCTGCRCCHSHIAHMTNCQSSSQPDLNCCFTAPCDCTTQALAGDGCSLVRFPSISWTYLRTLLDKEHD